MIVSHAEFTNAGGIREDFFTASGAVKECFAEEAEALFAAYESELAKYGCSLASEMLLRIHLSDVTNQIEILKAILKDRCSFVSVIGQPPVDNRRIAIEAWHWQGAGKSMNGDALEISLENYKVLWFKKENLQSGGSFDRIHLDQAFYISQLPFDTGTGNKMRIFVVAQAAMEPFVDIHSHHPLGSNLGLRNHRLGVDSAPPSEPFSAGIHPWDVGLVDNHEELLAELEHIKCLAIGEIGLDKACTSDFVLQQEVLERQLEIAARRQLPVIVHCVKSTAEIVATLAHHPLQAVIFHGFIGSTQQARQITEQGYYLSFGFGALRSPRTIEALKACPSSALFLETDTSEVPIPELYAEVAKLRGTTTQTLTEEIFSNYTKIFK